MKGLGGIKLRRKEDERGFLIRFTHHTQTQVEKSIRGGIPVTGRGTAVTGAQAPRAAAEITQHLFFSVQLRGSRFGRVGLGPFSAPFRNVAVHVVQPPGVGLLLTNRVRLVTTVSPVPASDVQRGLIPAGVIRRLGSGAAGIFPLSLGRKSIPLLLLSAKPLAEFLRLMPRDMLDRQIVAFKKAGVGSHDLLPLLLRHLGHPDSKSSLKCDLALRLVGNAVRLSFGAAHGKRARWNEDQFHAYGVRDCRTGLSPAGGELGHQEHHHR